MTACAESIWTTEGELLSCPTIIPDAARGVFITPAALGGTAPYTYSTVITLLDQGDRTIIESDIDTEMFFNRVDHNIPPDERVRIDVTATDAAGQSHTSTLTYLP